MIDPDLSIVIVNWNSCGYLCSCLKSVFAKGVGLSFEVLVIDNASYDGSAEMVHSEFPLVRFIQSTENFGFARANNLGFEHARGRLLLFLNPDTEIVGPALQVLAATLESSPDAGIVGPRLLNSDLSVQTSCVQRFPTILNQILDCDYLRTRLPNAQIWGMRPLWVTSSGPVEVEVIPGACLMVKRTVFEKASQFSPRYFMYSEDVDLCYEVRKSGAKVYFVNDAEVIHHAGRSSGASEVSHFASVMARESTYLFFLAKRGWTYASLYRAAMASAALVRLALLGMADVFLPQPDKRPRLASASKWRSILTWGLGRVPPAKAVRHPPAISQVL